MTASLEAVYAHLPRFMQNLACTYEGARIRFSRFGTEFENLLAAAEERSTWPAERVAEYRDQRLQVYLCHCCESVPYFRDGFRARGVDPLGIRTISDLHALPLLNKQNFAEDGPRLQSETLDPASRMVCHTSGTTGGGLRFQTTRRAYLEQWAVWWRYRRWHGITLDTKCAFFGGRSVVPVSQLEPPFWRYDRARHHVLFSGYHMSAEHLPYYIQELRRQRAPWICGYPSLLALLANYLLEKGTDLGYSPRSVTTLAENLLPSQKEGMIRAFGVPPRQHYGMAEGAANFSECEMGRLHVDEDFSAVEFLPDPGVSGCRVVGTAFLNPATAFVRYEVGDRVTLSRDGTCPCGRPGRIVEEIDGRLEDYVVRRDGSMVGRMDHIFKDLVNVREAQIFQETPGRISLRVVRGPNYREADEMQLRGETIKRLGSEMDIGIEYLESLPRGRGGKLRLVVSTLGKSKIDTAARSSRPSTQPPQPERI